MQTVREADDEALANEIRQRNRKHIVTVDRQENKTLVYKRCH